MSDICKLIGKDLLQMLAEHSDSSCHPLQQSTAMHMVYWLEINQR